MRVKLAGASTLTFALGLAASLAAAAVTSPLDVSAHARAFAPGELVRVVVRSPEPLAAASATFRGEPVVLVPGGGADAAREWAGWFAIDLDSKPGPANVRGHATTTAGLAAEGLRRVEVVAKRFPVSELKVAPKFVNPPPESMERIAREKAILAKVYASRREVPLPRAAFVRPVAGESLGVFGARRVFNGEKRDPHPGIDLRAATGTVVSCAGPGVVTLAQDLYFSGNTVIVDHGAGLFTIYAHLSEIDVKEGQDVEAGTRLGLSGATGRVTGPHLHWGGKLGTRIFDPTALADPALFATGNGPGA